MGSPNGTVPAVIDFSYPVVITIIFTITSTVKWWTQRSLQVGNKKTPWEWERRVAIGLLLTSILAYVFQALLNLYHAFDQDGWWAPQHSVINLLASITVWGVICAKLLGSPWPRWSPYVLSWIAGFAFELATCKFSVPDQDGATTFALLALAAHGVRLACFFLLNITAIRITTKTKQTSESDDEERQSLLGQSEAESPQYGSIPASENEVAEPEDPNKKLKEAQRKKLEEEGLFGYMKEFKIFLPCLWPAGNWRLQACIGMMVLHLVSERFLNVLVPRQVGIITNKLADGSKPWNSIALWVLFNWLNSFAGLGMINFVADRQIKNFSKQQISALAFKHVMSLSMDFHSDKDSGEVLKSVEQGGALIDLLDLVFFEITPVVLDTFIALFYITHLFDAYMASIVLFVGVIYITMSFKFTAMIQPIRRTSSESARAENKCLYESVSNWETVAYFNRVPHEQERYRKTVNDAIKSGMAYYYAWCYGYAAQSLVLTVGLLSASFLAVYQVKTQNKPVGNFVTLVLYWGTMISPLTRLTYSWKQITNTLVDAERLLQLLQTKNTIVDKEDASDLVCPGGKVIFDHVNFSYDTRKQTLSDVTFTVEPGQTVAFVGETGGGKSTTLKLLLRFYDVIGGSISIGGQDIRDVRLASLREAIGTVPQDPSLFNQTIMENVRYARLEASDDEVMEACKKAAVHEKIMGFPDQYKSKVGERGVKLSGGELQRIAIARIFLKNPSIVLLDEATSAVDSSIEAQIQSAFKKLSAGRTTFVVAHRLSTIVEADLILVIDQGKIIESGTHDDLIRYNSKYFELWSKQTAGKASKASSITIPVEEELVLTNDLFGGKYTEELQKNLSEPSVVREDQGGIGEEKDDE